MLRVCVIGFGRIGREHVNWIAESEIAQAVCVVDVTQACRERAIVMGLPAYAALTEALEKQGIDAVLVSVPTAFHFDAACDAIARGLHVMVEKPVALNFDEAKELHQRATAAGRVLSVFHNRRWDPDYLTLKRAIDAGELGTVFNVESRLTQYSSCVGPAAREFRPNWRNEKSFGGGGLFDWGSHFIDQLHLLLAPAKPVRVYAQLRGRVWSSDCDDFARVVIDFDTGVVAMMEINTITTRPVPRWRVDSQRGSVDAPDSPEFDTTAWAQLLLSPADGSPARLLMPAGAGLSESDIWRQFALACLGQGPPAVSMESVLLTMRLLDAARTSSDQGRAVEVD